MNVVNPNNTSHELKIVPRYYSNSESLNIVLYNESSQVSTIINLVSSLFSFTNNFNFLEDFLIVKINFSFEYNSRYQYKILDDTEIVYRGKIIATTQETQNYLTDKDEYYYE